MGKRVWVDNLHGDTLSFTITVTPCRSLYHLQSAAPTPLVLLPDILAHRPPPHTSQDLPESSPEHSPDCCPQQTAPCPAQVAIATCDYHPEPARPSLQRCPVGRGHLLRTRERGAPGDSGGGAWQQAWAGDWYVVVTKPRGSSVLFIAQSSACPHV